MVSTNQRDPLESGDVVIVALPSHIPRGHEQQGTRPAVVVGTVWGEVRYPTIAIVPVTTHIWEHLPSNNIPPSCQD
ncbi:MAG: type II toxin-antitoxin system PemK/MazF family toxin [Hormoscilla sp. GUM202]|nr:type II toxin-antitoxin system PemK/MazF family toxin [Hormoscilla sp. GUM202]